MHKEDQKKPTLRVGDSIDQSSGQQGESGEHAGAPAQETTAGPGVPPSLNPQNFTGVSIDDRYEVIEFIGEGGMGSVYKVKDRVLEKIFAVKLVKPELLKDNIAMKRFEQEAQSAISLTHPNLVSVYGHKLSSTGQPFLLMDYHPGSSLSEFLNQHGKIASSEAADLFALLSDALSHAHAKGIIHRDLKPSNIIIEKNSMGKLDPKIVDFGISKILSSNFTTMGFTKEQQIVGSPHYMSPEMCRGDKLDARSDVYSLGCVMFEVLEGRPPYQMENPFQTLMQHVGGDLPKFSQPSAVPPSLQGIVLKCLAKDPTHRYQNMEELRRDLERFKTGQKLAFAKPRKSLKIKTAHMIIAGGAIACFATGLLIMNLIQQSTPPGQPVTTTSTVQTQTVVTRPFDNILTWTIPDANPNDPEALIRRLKAADEQSDMRAQLQSRSMRGEPISFEQQRLRQEAVRVLEQQTQTALTAMGDKVIPVLVNHAFDETRSVRNVCFASMKDLGSAVTKPFVEKLMSSGKTVSDRMSANAVGEIGKPAISELMKYVSKGGDQQRRALQFIMIASTHGGDTSVEMSDVPELIRLINSNADASSKKIAMLSLVAVADRSDAVKDLFSRVAKDTNAISDLRVTAISALGTIANTESANASPSTQTDLQKIALSDKDAYIRFAATSNIAALGPKAEPSRATLTKLTKDRDAAVSMAARAGISLIDGNVIGSERGQISSKDLPAFVGEINSSISQEKIAEKIRKFGGALSNSPFFTLPTHPDFCGFTTPVLMNYVDKAGEHMSEKRYAYETLVKTGHYSNPATAWILLKASRDTDRWDQSSAATALLRMTGITQNY